MLLFCWHHPMRATPAGQTKTARVVILAASVGLFKSGSDYPQLVRQHLGPLDGNAQILFGIVPLCDGAIGMG